MHYIESNYKLTMNDVAILELIEQNCENNMLMQPFQKLQLLNLVK